MTGYMVKKEKIFPLPYEFCSGLISHMASMKPNIITFYCFIQKSREFLPFTNWKITYFSEKSNTDQVKSFFPFKVSAYYYWKVRMTFT